MNGRCATVPDGPRVAIGRAAQAAKGHCGRSATSWLFGDFVGCIMLTVAYGGGRNGGVGSVYCSSRLGSIASLGAHVGRSQSRD